MNMVETEKKVERIYTVNLKDAYEHTRKKRAMRAIKLLREFVAKHMKTELETVKISETVNSYVWRDSIEKPPRKIKIKVVKQNGMVDVSMHDEEQTTALKEQKKKQKEQKKQTKQKKEPKQDAKTQKKTASTETKPPIVKENKKVEKKDLPEQTKK